MSGYDAASITVNKNLWIGDASLVSKTNGSLIMMFHRSITDGVAPISTTAPTTVIWAFSLDNTQPLAYHGDKRRGSFQVDFSCNGGGGGVATQPTTPVPAQGTTQVTVGSSCPVSTLGQYDHQADLYDGKILLHWKVLPGPVFQMALEAKRLSGAENSWISVAGRTTAPWLPLMPSLVTCPVSRRTGSMVTNSRSSSTIRFRWGPTRPLPPRRLDPPS
ncbi:hypothetical protein CLOP_g16940 [Closterium sp. NIES-67]|nr:hypothetical protein CLOP_g16940 [Closterium sp. NIES-67]